MPPREGRSVSFYIAIFLTLLLVVSAGLNVLLLLFSALGSAAGGLGSVSEADSAFYEVVAVGGDANTDDKILRIRVEGAIAELGSPLIGAAGGSVSDMRRSLRVAARDRDIKGVLIDINSPGGGVTDSDEIYRIITDFRAENPEIPVVALFGDTAASGGYYIAAACERIMARPTTITGSIGVIMSSYNFAEAAQNVGIREVVIKSTNTPFKDMMTPFRPLTEKEEEILGSIVEEFYQRFVNVVNRGRPDLTRERVQELADGRIYTGYQAFENGLVDMVVDIDEAIEELQEMMSVTSAQIVEHRRRPGFIDLLLGVIAPDPSLQSVAARLLESTSGARFLYFWPGGR